MRATRRLALAFFPVWSLLASPGATATPAPGVVPGAYGELLVGFDPATHRVSGYFESETGRGQFSCIFYLSGAMVGGTSQVRSYFPADAGEAIAGVLRSTARGAITLALRAEHGGCWNVRHFADRDAPAAFALQKAYPWIGVAIVRRERAWFVATPSRRAARRAYVVKGNGLGVRAVRDGWLRVDYVGGRRPVSGWISAADVYPISPPPAAARTVRSPIPLPARMRSSPA